MTSVVNTYVKLNDGTTKLEINGKDGLKDILIDSKHTKEVMKKRWYVSANDERVLAVKEDGGSMLKNFIARLEEGLNKRIKLKKDNEHDLRCSNMKNIVGDEKNDNWRDGIKNRYSKDWSLNLTINAKNTAKINKDIAEEIRSEALKGRTQAELVLMYGIKRSTIADVLNYRTWNEDIVSEDIVKIYKKELDATLNTFKLSDDNNLKNINSHIFLSIKFRTFISDYETYNIKLLAINKHQFYLEYYHKGHYIGSSQHLVNNPLTPENRRSCNHSIIKIKKDSYGYAKENNTVLTRELVYQILNSISNSDIIF